MSKNNFSKKIDRYTLALIKENFPFLLLLIVSVFILFFIKNYYFQTYRKNLTKLKEVKFEVERLENSKNKIENLNFNQDKIDKYFQIINILLPNKENIFTIISALENLSSSTGFYISNYSLTPSLEKKSGEVEVVVNGFGNKESFMKLLENYNFSSGRLITMDKLNYNIANQSTIKLVFKFHTRKSPKLKNITQVVLPEKKEISWLDKIISKVKINNIIPVDSSDILYRTKPNPFE